MPARLPPQKLAGTLAALVGDTFAAGMDRDHPPRPVLKCHTSQVRNTKTIGHAQPKRMAIERVSPFTCEGSLAVLPREANAQATFNAQPLATAIAPTTKPFKWERDLTSQKSTTGSRRAASNRAVVANFLMTNPNKLSDRSGQRQARIPRQAETCPTYSPGMDRTVRCGACVSMVPGQRAYSSLTRSRNAKFVGSGPGPWLQFAPSAVTERNVVPPPGD
jgi:hypothetical protein